MEDGDISIGTIARWFFAFLGIIITISLALWAFGVFSSGVKGKGDVIKKNNSADNQIQAQDAFNTLWNQIKAYKGDITADAATVTKDDTTGKDDTYDKSVLAAVQSTCRNAVGQYNGYTIDTTMKDWRPFQDPASLDATTECEVTP